MESFIGRNNCKNYPTKRCGQLYNISVTLTTLEIKSFSQPKAALLRFTNCLTEKKTQFQSFYFSGKMITLKGFINPFLAFYVKQDTKGLIVLFFFTFNESKTGLCNGFIVEQKITNVEFASTFMKIGNNKTVHGHFFIAFHVK